MRFGEIRIEPHRLPGIPLRLGDVVGVGDLAARRAERHAMRQVRVRARRSRIELDRALERAICAAKSAGTKLP